MNEKVMVDTALSLTKRLIQCGSFNPPGNEKQAAAICCELLESCGFDAKVDEFAENRCNVIGILGDRSNIMLMLGGHLDVVPVSGGWTVSPVAGFSKDGYIYGRGACDMLGGCASILSAAVFAASRLKNQKYGIAVVLTADEEEKYKGVKRFLSSSDIKPKNAIIAEPTNLQLHIGHRGYASYYLKTSGKSCHASQPQNGVNAIYKMAHVLQSIESYEKSLNLKHDKMLGCATASVGTVQGGVKLNTVPDSCMAELERRTLPGETESEIYKEIAEAAGDECEVVMRSFFPATLIAKNNPLVQVVSSSYKNLFKSEQIIDYFPACSEASMYGGQAGIPTIICGPGDIKYAHRENERCSEQQIMEAAKLFVELILKAAVEGIHE